MRYFARTPKFSASKRQYSITIQVSVVANMERLSLLISTLKFVHDGMRKLKLNGIGRANRFTATIISLFFLSGDIKADDAISQLRMGVSKWVEIEKTISKESIEWDEKKALLENLTEVLNQEIKLKKSELDKTKSATNSTDLKRKELVEKSEQNQEIFELIQISTEQFESQIKKLVTKFPLPLQKKLAPQLNRLPNDFNKPKVSLASRMQNIIGIIAEIQNFDQLITTGEEIMDDSTNAAKEIQTIHIGLGASYYITSDGKEAGVGNPTNEGWKWKSVAGIAPEVKKAIYIININTTEPELLLLPVSPKRTER